MHWGRISALTALFLAMASTIACGDETTVAVDQYNPVETDTDGDGVVDAEDAFPTNADETLDFDGDGIGNNADPDDDNDGMSDHFEQLYGLNTLNPADADTDLDGDGKSNLEEFNAGSSPKVAEVVNQIVQADGHRNGVGSTGIWFLAALLMWSGFSSYLRATGLRVKHSFWY